MTWSCAKCLKLHIYILFVWSYYQQQQQLFSLHPKYIWCDKKKRGSNCYRKLFMLLPSVCKLDSLLRADDKLVVLFPCSCCQFPMIKFKEECNNNNNNKMTFHWKWINNKNNNKKSKVIEKSCGLIIAATTKQSVGSSLDQGWKNKQACFVSETTSFNNKNKKQCFVWSVNQRLAETRKAAMWLVFASFTTRNNATTKCNGTSCDKQATNSPWSRF